MLHQLLLFPLINSKPRGIIIESIDLSKDDPNLTKNSENIFGLFYIFVITNNTDITKDADFIRIRKNRASSKARNNNIKKILQSFCLKLFKRILTKCKFLPEKDIYTHKSFESDIKKLLQTSFFDFGSKSDINLVREYLDWAINTYLERMKDTKSFYIDYYDLIMRKLEETTSKSEIQTELTANIALLLGDKFVIQKKEYKNTEKDLIPSFYTKLEERIKSKYESLPTLSKIRKFYKEFDINKDIKFNALYSTIVEPNNAKVIEFDPEKQDLNCVEDTSEVKTWYKNFSAWPVIGIVALIVVLFLGIGVYVFKNK